jgi:hypothetical protein
MATLSQRLRRLEKRFTDRTGLVPYSERWYSYWEDIFERLMAGENPTFPGRLPLAVTDRMIERADRADGIIP